MIRYFVFHYLISLATKNASKPNIQTPTKKGIQLQNFLLLFEIILK
jgi:hypothetical protein